MIVPPIGRHRGIEMPLNVRLPAVIESHTLRYFAKLSHSSEATLSFSVLR